LNLLFLVLLLNPRSGLGIFRSHPPLGIIALAIILFENEIYLNLLFYFFWLNPRSELGIFRSHPLLGSSLQR
jgi:hypothetical protein